MLDVGLRLGVLVVELAWACWRLRQMMRLQQRMKELAQMVQGCYRQVFDR
jgi:hypothetical protein